ncbi:hypothetical protein L9F63_008330 [Diploptera punctata]|uniref:Uncharacterized protein n=1 Tax=Diploptera punctata TaxID=6984 RepID=A0AAD7Z5Z5_DIPPU|nr:hypothetical protein L9F63_008330 [Diploptera punctata]
MDRGRKTASAQELESKNQLLPHNEINPVIEGPANPSPKSSPTHQRKRKVEEIPNLDVHVSEVCTITKHTVFKEIFPSSSDSSEDEDRGDLRINSTTSKLKVEHAGLDNIGSASLEEASSSENSHFDSHNVKPCKFLRIKSSSVKKSIEKGKQNVLVANKFKNLDKGDCESVARY